MISLIDKFDQIGCSQYRDDSLSGAILDCVDPCTNAVFVCGIPLNMCCAMRPDQSAKQLEIQDKSARDALRRSEVALIGRRLQIAVLYGASFAFDDRGRPS
jgi:epoxyqueuosine reductase QueG